MKKMKQSRWLSLYQEQKLKITKYRKTLQISLDECVARTKQY